MNKRDEKKQQIIKMAKEVFLSKGFFGTVMDDIAKKSGLTRRTIYRYFETKEDLAYETTTLLLNEWNDFHEDTYSKLTGNALEQFSTFLYKSIDFMKNKTEVMKYLGEFDFYFSQENDKKASDDCLARFDNVILKSDEILRKILKKGIADDSIKKT